jgi:hypothetical protein
MRVVAIVLVLLSGASCSTTEPPEVTVGDHEAAISREFDGISCDGLQVLDQYPVEDETQQFLLKARCDLGPDDDGNPYVREFYFIATYRVDDPQQAVLVGVERFGRKPSRSVPQKPSSEAWAAVIAFVALPLFVGLVLFIISLLFLRMRRKHKAKATAGTFRVNHQPARPSQTKSHWTINEDASGGKSG